RTLIFIQKDIYLDIIADKNKVQDPSGNKVHILDFKKTALHVAINRRQQEFNRWLEFCKHLLEDERRRKNQKA
ncbi:hypothetical protein EBR57_06885, partial [bacterium]|nr:hypothetical protein [bacterium]